MSCTNKAHWPLHTEFPAEADVHLHCAGRIVVRDGRVVVVDATPCEREGG